MRYLVVKAFSDCGTVRVPGDTIELDDSRAAKLRRYGLIGRYEQPIRTAVPVEEIREAVIKTPAKSAKKKPAKKGVK